MDRHPALLVRPFNDDFRHRRLPELAHQEVADFDVLVQEPPILALAREPARVPGAVDAEPQADRIDLLTHQAFPSCSSSRTTIVRFENVLKMRPERPRPRGVQRLMTNALPTCASATTRSSTSRS